MDQVITLVVPIIWRVQKLREMLRQFYKPLRSIAFAEHDLVSQRECYDAGERGCIALGTWSRARTG